MFAGRFAALLSLLSASLLAAASDADETQGRRALDNPPNIILILADDLGFGDLSCLGQTHFQTPHLDRMAAEGMLFHQFYAGCTVCAPSRACLLTGQHTGHVYQRFNGDVQFREDPLDITIATRLQQLGYRTAMIGKSGLSGNRDDGDLPNRKGFDHFFGFVSHLAAHRYYPRQLWRDSQRIEYESNDETEGEFYSGDLFLADSLQWIEANREGPFFLHLSLQQPHADLAAPDRFVDPFVGEFTEQAFTPGQHYRATEHPLATFAGMVTYLDHSVGQVLDKLVELEIDRQTVVFFTSDNGPHGEGGKRADQFNSSGSLRGHKRDFYEGGIRVPLIVRWPGHVAPGSTTKLVSAQWDFAPTALEIAGSSPNAEMDGISFLPTLESRPLDQATHDYLYWEFHEQGGKQAVRMHNWKGIRLNVQKNPDGPIELYDLAADEQETTDVAERHPEIVERIRSIMAEAHVDTDRVTLQGGATAGGK